MLKKMIEIHNGYKNLLKSRLQLLPGELERLGQVRYNICLNCELRNKDTDTCMKCKCYLPAKTVCEKCKCPKGYW